MNNKGIERGMNYVIMSGLSLFPSTQIRIRDPNQGGKDITEEIMAGSGNTTPPVGRPSSTPTPPQVGRTPPVQAFSLLLGKGNCELSLHW